VSTVFVHIATIPLKFDMVAAIYSKLCRPNTSNAGALSKLESIAALQLMQSCFNYRPIKNV
jgi:hypothetical protein